MADTYSLPLSLAPVFVSPQLPNREYVTFFLNVKLKLFREKYNFKITGRGSSSCQETSGEPHICLTVELVNPSLFGRMDYEE
jgi:hypothetical protein